MAVKVHTHDSCTRDFMVIIPNTESAVKLRNDISFFFLFVLQEIIDFKILKSKRIENG